MTLAGLFALGALLYVVWLRLGWQQMTPAEVPDLRRNAVSTVAACAFPAAYTLLEYGSWDHLTFPYSLIVWAALLLTALIAGLVQLARGHRASGWPLLGLPVSAGLLAVLAALLDAARNRAG